MSDNGGFSVIEPVEIGTLEDVKEQRVLMPPTKNVKMIIKRVDTLKNEERTWKGLRLSLQLVDGISIGDDVKYKGAYIRTEAISYYADPEVYTKDFFKEKRHLVGLKRLMKATGVESSIIDDNFVNELIGKIVLADIWQRDNAYTDKSGTEVKDTINEARFLKAVPTDQLV